LPTSTATVPLVFVEYIQNLKSCVFCCVSWLTRIISKVWDTGHAPCDWKRLQRGTILPIYKDKGSKYSCSNYKGITVLSVSGKLYFRVLRSSHTYSSFNAKNSGFTSRRSTTDRIATLRMILQKRQEYNQRCWVAYVDFHAPCCF